MSLTRLMTPAEVGELVGFSARTVVEWAKPKNGRPGEFGEGAYFFPFPANPKPRVRPGKASPGAGKGGVRPPRKLGEWRIEEGAFLAWLARRRAFFAASGHSDGEEVAHG